MSGRIAAASIARWTFARYLLASICALCGDMMLFLTLVRSGFNPGPAAVAGYLLGLLLHWLISVRFVFTSSDPPTHAQRAGFIASAVVGLGITITVVSGLTLIGCGAAAAKLVAVPVSFLTVYAIRKYGVFASA